MNVTQVLAQEAANINPGLAAIGYGTSAIGAAIGVGMIWSAVISALLWPWLSFALRDVRKRLGVN